MTRTALFDSPGPRARRRIIVYSIVAALLAFGTILVGLGRLSDHGQLEADKWTVFFTDRVLIDFLLVGLKNTIIAALVALALSFILGMLLALGRLQRVRVVRSVCTLFVEFFRSVPVLLSILFLFLAFPMAFTISLPAFWSMVLALTLYNGAVICEIIRAGVVSLPIGQREAAYAIGLGWPGTMAYVLLPQALRIMLPVLISQFVVLIKDTSLGFIIGYQELMARGENVGLLFNNPIQVYVLVAIVYVGLNSLVSRASNYVAAGRQQKWLRVDEMESEEAKRLIQKSPL